MSLRCGDGRLRCVLCGTTSAVAEVVFEVPRCPLAGLYCAAEEAGRERLREDLEVLRCPSCGHVQLRAPADPAVYRRYAFSGGVSGAYTGYLDGFAGRVARACPRGGRILEVGSGDGTLLRLLAARLPGALLAGVEPSREQAGAGTGTLPPSVTVYDGYFPDALPDGLCRGGFDAVVARHVLEHVPEPVPFARALASACAPGGAVWIEVPDLESGLAKGLFSNFHHLHRSYFSGRALRRLLEFSGLAVRRLETVATYGGSLLARCRPAPRGAEPAFPVPAAGASAFRDAVRVGPETGLVGYGAAERTAVLLGVLGDDVRRFAYVCDANPSLQGKYMAGLDLAIRAPDVLAGRRHDIVLFAVSNRVEILRWLRGNIDPSSRVLVAERPYAWAFLRDLT